jgi:hypothetical protein
LPLLLLMMMWQVLKHIAAIFSGVAQSKIETLLSV